MTELVEKARALALKVLEGETRSDGSPFMNHVDGVARIVDDEIGLGESSVAAVYLHEATRKHKDISIADFPKDVRIMVDGLNKISTIRPKDTRLEAENYKKLIVSYSADPRVTVIKIGDRLEVMRSLGIFPKTSREQKLLETLLLYIPLAHQLGLYNIKRELEDIWLKHSRPEQYRTITNSLKATEKDREKLTHEFIEPLKIKLSEAGIKYRLKIRTKSAYSIFTKMQKQKVNFDGVFDVFAIRFIIDCPDDSATEKDQCWKVYSYVTEEYEPDTNRLRDWLTNPKPNGYESLHITVKDKEGRTLEVQIRTERMDALAENGSAAHWAYKGVQAVQNIEKWLEDVRYKLEHPYESRSGELPEPPKDEVFVFTPDGDLKTLRSGSSVLDFAFLIHSGLGCRCTGGKINGKVVPIKEKLTTGDVVEILSSKNQHPSRDWLNHVVTTKAKVKIRQELDAEERKAAAAGREVLARRLKNWKMTLSDDLLREIMKERKYTSNIEFFADIAAEKIDVNDLKARILQNDAREAVEVEETTAQKTWTASKGSSDGILVLSAKDVKGMDYNMARCCNPVFGDEVFGFVTRTEGIKIHRMSCPNAARLMDRYPYRIQKVAWVDKEKNAGEFQCTLTITAEPEGNVLAAAMEVISAFKASVRNVSVRDNARDHTQEISVRLLVPSNMELDKIISQLVLRKGVLRVRR